MKVTGRMRLKRKVRERIQEVVTGELVEVCCSWMASFIKTCGGIRIDKVDSDSFSMNQTYYRFCPNCGAKVEVETERTLPEGYFKKLKT